MNQDKRVAILEILRANNPNPQTELKWSTPFELLVAVALSAQATDVGVNKATDKLFPVANTPQAILELGEEGLKQYLNTINFYNNKCKNLIKMCKALVELHGGEVPEDRDALEALAGVGHKTANVVLNTAFGWNTVAVDTHIFRVANRMNFAPGKNVDEVEQRLLKVVPEEFLYNVHHWLILHGRYTCKALKPNCSECPLFELCESKEKYDYLSPGDIRYDESKLSPAKRAALKAKEKAAKEKAKAAGKTAKSTKSAKTDTAKSAKSTAAKSATKTTNQTTKRKSATAA